MQWIGFVGKILAGRSMVFFPSNIKVFPVNMFPSSNSKSYGIEPALGFPRRMCLRRGQRHR